ncbi:sigma factor [Actinocorallia sp. B10E7]|uniref:RNA polymerase sigma factor n=1 Tax=Actinocorallia sp. B10E7 TaxID=3153558 RepID=UPI00325D9846
MERPGPRRGDSGRSAARLAAPGAEGGPAGRDRGRENGLRPEDAEIHGYAARRLGADATEDVVAEAFLTAYRKRGSYDPAKGSARAWLHGITTNLVGRHRGSGCRCPDARTVRRMVSSPARKADHRPGDRVGRAAVEPTRS